MATSIQSNLEFKLTSIITVNDGVGDTFTISKDLEREQLINASLCSIVFKTADRRIVERMQVTIVNGTATIVLRGLDQSDTKTEVAGLKKERRVGTSGYLTVFASDIFDKDGDGTQVITGGITFSGATTFDDSMILGPNSNFDMSGSKNSLVLPNLTTAERLALTPTNGDIVYDTDLGLNMQYTAGAWGTVDTGTPVSNASETVAGKVEKATDSEAIAGTDIGGTGAYLFITPSQTASLISSSLYLLKTNKYKTGENLVNTNSVTFEGQPLTTDSIVPQKIGALASNTRISKTQILSGTAGTTIKLMLSKTGTPAVNLGVRLETDNAGEPSGTLIDANAITTIAPGSLTTTLVDTTITFPGSITNTAGDIVHIVLYQGTFGSETVDANNHYNLGQSLDNTTIRKGKSYNGSVRTEDYGRDITKLSYTTKSLNVSAQNTVPYGTILSQDGTKAYMIGQTATATIFQYTLTTPWDLATGSYASKSLAVGAQDSDPQAIQFSPDGTKVYVMGTTNDRIYQYNLTTARDISTGVYFGVGASFIGQDIVMTGFVFRNNGKEVYMIGQQLKKIIKYTLTTAWDITTISYAGILSPDISALASENFVKGIYINNEGTKVFVSGTTNKKIYEFSITSRDITTLALVNSTSVTTEDTAPTNIQIRNDGAVLYVFGYTNKKLFQYTLSNNPLDSKAYTSSDMFESLLLTKTNSNYNYKVNKYGFATEIKTKGQTVNIATDGNKDGFTGLSNLTKYYLGANGLLSTVVGTFEEQAGKSINSTDLVINNTFNS